MEGRGDAARRQAAPVCRSTPSRMREDTESLVSFIEMVQTFPCLYDYTRADYCNKQAQEEAWLSISRNINEKVRDCKERWRNIRGRYVKYLNQVYGGKQIKEYYLAKHLHFLANFLKHRKHTFRKFPRRTDDEEDVDEDGDDAYDDKEGICETALFEDETSASVQSFVQNAPTTPSSPLPLDDASKSGRAPPSCHEGGRKRKVATPSDEEPTWKCVATAHGGRHVIGDPNDPDVGFLQSILPDMRAMSDRQKRKFKLAILNLTDQILDSTSEPIKTDS